MAIFRSTKMTIDQRVEQLEQKCRQLRRVLNCTMLAIVAAVLVAAAPVPATKALQTERLEIVDGNGKVRIRLGSADEGYGLVVYDGDGTYRATLTDAPRGAAMQLRKGGGGIKLLAMQEGCGITVRDEKGVPRVLVVQQDTGAEIMLKDQAGKTVFSAPE